MRLADDLIMSRVARGGVGATRVCRTSDLMILRGFVVIFEVYRFGKGCSSILLYGQWNESRSHDGFP